MKPITGDNLTQRAIDCAMEVHRRLGQGFTKDLYENCMALELTAAGLPFERGRVPQMIYDGQRFDFTCQTDFIVADKLVVQVEAVDAFELAHEQKLRTCLWMGGYKSGLLLNFNVSAMDDGIIRVPPNIVVEQQHLDPVSDVFDDPGLGSTT